MKVSRLQTLTMMCQHSHQGISLHSIAPEALAKYILLGIETPRQTTENGDTQYKMALNPKSEMPYFREMEANLIHCGVDRKTCHCLN